MGALSNLHPVYSSCVNCGRRIYRYTSKEAWTNQVWYHSDVSDARCFTGSNIMASPVSLKDYVNEAMKL